MLTHVIAFDIDTAMPKPVTPKSKYTAKSQTHPP